MKKERNGYSILLVLFLVFGGLQTSEAQFLKKLKKRVKDSAEETVLRKTEEKVTQKTEKTFDTIINGKLVKLKRKVKRKPSDKPTSNSGINSSDQEQENASAEDIKSWTKYNFVPGDEIIFEDDLTSEENGEFPSRWDLIKGNAENATLGEDNVINMLHTAKIKPLMNDKNYLPEVFTIEFDAYFQPVHGPAYQSYHINLWNGSQDYKHTSEDKKSYCRSLIIKKHGASLECMDNGEQRKYEFYDNSQRNDKKAKWQHIAIAFNKRSLKVFIEENRVLNIPNLGFQPEAFILGIFAHYKEISAIKDIRIAKGGKKLYDQIIADGKFVTRGILFDVNKASIKPASYGVINKVAKMMLKHTDLNFSIEGHTDSDGPEDYNQELSAKRALAVKKALIQMGIAADRLNTLGKGEAVPITDNTTAEGKANNRRVEFVKL